MDQEMNSTVKDLIAALSSQNDETRVEARKKLVAMGSKAIPSLGEALKDRDLLRRWEAAKALGEIGNPKAAPMLVAALEDEQFDVRWLSAKGLIDLNIRALRPLFEALMDRPDSVTLLQGAHHVLHDLAKGELRVYLKPLLTTLESGGPRVEVPRTVSQVLEQLKKAKIL
jgi:HEAT repeat protein